MPAAYLAPAVWSLVFCTAVAIAAAPDTPPDNAAPQRAASVPADGAAEDLSPVFTRIRRAASNDDWRREGWNDKAIRDALSGLVEQVKKAADVEALALPVNVGDVHAPAAVEPHRFQGALWVGKNVSMTRAEGAVILADGNVEIPFANDCLIVARGAVYIAHGTRNVVVAGQYIHVSHDGAREGPGGGGGGSLLISGGVVDGAHADHSVCSAPGLVRISHARGVRLINSPNAKISNEQNCMRVAGAKLPVALAAKENPLAEKLKLTQVVYASEADQRLVTFEWEGVEMLVRLGQEIRDGAGKPIPELAGWTLTFVCYNYAMFSKDGEDAGFIVLRPGE
jgi:hypothetical protein